MSFETWHTYGYGVKLSKLKSISIDKVLELIKTAPKLSKKFEDWRVQCKIETPTLEDIEEFDDNYGLGLATILRDVISEAEGINLTACDEYWGAATYLLYEQTYPWYMTNKEKTLTEVDIQSLFVKYLSKITDETITIDYYNPENGG